ncbi:uncharacterized protein LOC142972201 [Anticarsia gemmatalis]|uniref:uncharacterized protein LOC142972201 n=1 Tax=Anticarsia gemmatalis TaxID=129554 RepID=UPI003F76DC4D
MPPKDKKDTTSASGKTLSSTQPSGFTDSDENYVAPRCVSLNLQLHGSPGEGDFMFLCIFRGLTILDGKWQDGLELGTDAMPLNLNDSRIQMFIMSNPLILLLRAISAKPAKQDPDPFLNTDNRAGGNVDLSPLLLGEEEVATTVHLLSITTGEFLGCEVEVRAVAPGSSEITNIPLLITMISAHCMPVARDGTVYLGAVGLDGIHKPKAVDFGQSLSTPEAKKLVWASVATAGHVADTALSVPGDDRFVPDNLNMETTGECRSFYWNSINRVLVDSAELIERLSSPFLIEVAGVPRVGKVDVRGRFMSWVDARSLLEPGQMDITINSKLLFYNEANLPPNVGGLLELPPTSAKGPSARDNDQILDDFGHMAYIVIRFDLREPLFPKAKLVSLYESIGFPVPEGPAAPVETFDDEPEPENPIVDVRRIRKEGGALAVHKELCNLACRGDVPMNQGIKRSAANRLLVRVRALLKSFPAGECSYIDWQDTITGQHGASRRAVTASFDPQPPPPRLPDRIAAARSKIAGDQRIADKHIAQNLKVAGSHPRSLICKTIRCLEERKDLDARNYLFEALNRHIRNRYLLWILGAQEFDKGSEGAEIASAAFRIAVKGDYSDGTANAIAWAALHAFYHFNGNVFGAHIALRKMRKFYSLPREWQKILKRWSDVSGEEEVFWMPHIILSDNPFLITAAFFLCFRCFKFSECLLQCVENNCATIGSNSLECPITADVYYLRAASLIIRRQLNVAMEVTQQGIQRFGPSGLMSQMRLTCLACIRGWDGECEKAFDETEKAGAPICPSMLYKAALSGFKTNPIVALQRAALAHKVASSGHTALLIGRIYSRLGEDGLAERWCAGAVKIEPLLSDGWAMLAILAMYQRNMDKARTMLRTARQVGPISPDIEQNLNKVMEIVDLDQLPDSLVKNLCIKKSYDYN